jgi:hypothetical protein
MRALKRGIATECAEVEETANPSTTAFWTRGGNHETLCGFAIGAGTKRQIGMASRKARDSGPTVRNG